MNRVKKYYDPITTDMDQNSDCVNEHTPVFVDEDSLVIL